MEPKVKSSEEVDRERWICDHCGAVHHYNVDACKKCSSTKLTKSIIGKK